MNFFSIVMKGVTRNKIRTGLTWLSIFVAFLMFGVLSAMDDLFSGKLIKGNFSERLIVQSTYGLPLPKGYYEKIKKMDGVIAEEVTYNSIIGGYFQKKENRFMQQATNAENYLLMQKDYYTLQDDHRKEWLRDKSGALVGRDLAEVYGWKVGDRIPIISSIHPRKDGEPWQLNIRGIMKPKNDSLQSDFMVLHFDYLAQGRGDIYDVFWYEVNVADANQVDSVARRIDANFENSARSTSTQTMASIMSQFSAQFANFGFIASLILGAVFFTMVLVSGNTMMLAFTERMHELAVLKSIGFSGIAILCLLLSESIGLVLVGGVPALGLLWVVQDTFQTWFAGFYVRPAVMVEGVILMLIMGIVIGVIPAIKAKRLTIVEALRKR